MGFLNTDSMPRLVEKLADGDNIKITGNSKGSKVGTVVKKIVEKADDVTKAIEQEVVNDSYSFKVGTGDVDVSSDVEDGFGEVGLKGVTYRNLLLTPKDEFPISILQGLSHSLPILPPTKDITLIAKFSNIVEGKMYRFSIGNKFYDGIFSPIVRLKWNYSDVANATNVHFGCHQSNNQAILTELIILEGDHVDNPNIPNHFEGIVGVGDKSKNLFNKSTITPNKAVSSSNGILNVNTSASCSDFIPVDANTNYTISGRNGSLVVYYTNDYSYIGSFNGQSLTTPSNCRNIRFNFLNSDCVDAIQLEKGTVVTTYEPHYDGHKIEILSCGKNLVDINKITKSHSNNAFEIIGDKIKYTGYGINSFRQPRIPIYVKPNSNIIFTCKSVENTNVYVKLVTPNEETLYTSYDFKNNTVVTKNVANNTMIYLELGKHKTELNDITIYDIQIEESTQATQYSSYVSDKTQILLDEPLMRLPNGTHDEITRDGKLIRRVVKVVLDGSENWSLSDGTKENTIRFSTIPQIPFKILTEAISDKFPYYQNTGNNVECFTVANDTKIHIRIERSKLNVANVQGFKQWLSENPTTVYYELETPITAELPALYLRIFKDGHLTFNTLVAPKSNHVVQLNKSAQIERSIREVQSLDSRVGKLESFYDDMMLETSHKLSLLNYDFEYTRERNGE